jgi:hypothetical protein
LLDDDDDDDDDDIQSFYSAEVIYLTSLLA